MRKKIFKKIDYLKFVLRANRQVVLKTLELSPQFDDNLIKRIDKKNKQFMITSNRKWKRRRIDKEIDKILLEED